MRSLSALLLLTSPLLATYISPVGANGYYAIGSSGNTYSSIISNGGTFIVGTNADDVVATVSLPFDISLYGVTYAAGALITVSTNGNVQFAASGGSNSLTNVALGSVSFITSPAIFGYWDDVLLTTPGGGIYQRTLGSLGGQQFILEWQGRRFGDGAVTTNIRFQVVFVENSTDIRVNYDLTGIDLALNGVDATTGVRLDNSNYTQWSHNTAVLTSGLSILYTLTDPNPSTVPEPSSMAMLTLAAGAWGWARGRRRGR